MPNSANSASAATDIWHTRAALCLARRGLGRVMPNPAVGCIIVKDGIVVGRGWTQPGGRPHAEAEALRQAGGAARGATAYVSLEPCSHHGKTPPCADALIEAGIGRCVVSLRDPDPRVSGDGIERLRGAGIDVDEGVCETDAADVNQGFLSRVSTGRPMVTLKLATTLDARIATASGDSKWITGEAARRYGHLLRARHDALLTGVGTVLADDPMLDCRLKGLEGQSPIRVILDTDLRTPVDGQLVSTAKTVPVLLLTGKDPSSREAQALAEAGATVIQAPVQPGGGLDLAAAMAILADRGITRVLAECGSELAAGLIKTDLVDRIAWFRAATLIGGDGLGALAALNIDKAAQARRFTREQSLVLGEDVLETYRRTSY